MPHPTQMSPADTGLLVIDMQEKLVPKIHGIDALLKSVALLIDAAHLLGIPVQATEQYPKGLGATVSPLVEKLPERPDKVDFSCCAVPSVVENFRRAARPKVVLAGIEAHVCVQMTALDLLARDFRVFVPADAVGSRYPIDHEFALRRLERAGAIVTTTEATVFEWTGGAGCPQFKQISQLIKNFR